MQVLHLIRHCQGYHNVAGKVDPGAYRSFDYWDAHLTQLGWQQAAALRRHIQQLGPAFRADVVVISPLTRTLETAAGVFGSGPWGPGDPGTPFMLPQGGINQAPGTRARTAQDGIAAAGLPRLLAWEGCREHLGQVCAVLALLLGGRV